MYILIYIFCHFLPGSVGCEGADSPGWSPGSASSSSCSSVAAVYSPPGSHLANLAFLLLISRSSSEGSSAFLALSLGPMFKIVWNFQLKTKFKNGWLTGASWEFPVALHMRANTHYKCEYALQKGAWSSRTWPRQYQPPGPGRKANMHYWMNTHYNLFFTRSLNTDSHLWSLTLRTVTEENSSLKTYWYSIVCRRTSPFLKNELFWNKQMLLS